MIGVCEYVEYCGVFFVVVQEEDVFFFKQKSAYEVSACLVGSDMCIRDRHCQSAPRYYCAEDGTRSGPALCVSLIPDETTPVAYSYLTLPMIHSL